MSQKPVTPEVSQSLIGAAKSYFEGHLKDHIRGIGSVSLLVILAISFFWYRSSPTETTEKVEQLSQEILPEANAQPTKPNQETPYLINPFSHTAWKPYIVAPGDTLAQLLKKAGLTNQAWQEIIALGDHAKILRNLSSGQIINIDNQNGLLIALSQSLDSTRTLYVLRQKNGQLDSFIHEKERQTRVAFANATIEDSLVLSGKRANIDDNIMGQLTEIFGCVIDFSHDIHPNDSFKILYEEQFVEDQKIGSGQILAVEFNNAGKVYQAIRYIDPKGTVSYYSPNGMSFKRTFLRTPVKFSRISSYFCHQRRHPILHHIRAHKGVDYVAPAGTPVKAVGDGVIRFHGRKGGYGKTIILDHDAKHSTLYAHLSGFAKNIAPGRRVTQGQIIGYVGSSGLATGDHLHYEFRINDKHHNPLNTPFSQPVPIPVDQHQLFFSQVAEVMDLLNYHEKIMMASNEY